MVKLSRRTRIALWTMLVVVAGILFYIWKVSWYERYVWPGPIESMQELPPVDRSGWPNPPTPWRTETQPIEVATPEGLKVREITYQTNGIDMDFVRIEPGSFRPLPGFRSVPEKWPLRRATRWNPQPQPPLVTISRPYYMGAFEVTNLQFEQFDPSHRNRRPKYQKPEKGNWSDFHPVEGVTWQEAQEFARWLSRREGRLYRLPTEAEFEYAARAGTDSRFYWGEAFWDRSKANLGGLHSNAETAQEDGYDATAPVGAFPANPWGLYDMVGNSFEWVADWWHLELKEDAVDPKGPKEGHMRMEKGGNWKTRPYAMYTGENDGDDPADLRDKLGFRLLVEIE